MQYVRGEAVALGAPLRTQRTQDAPHTRALAPPGTHALTQVRRARTTCRTGQFRIPDCDFRAIRACREFSATGAT